MSQKLRWHLPPLLGWTAVWLIFFLPLLLGWQRLPNGDFAGQFHAFGLFQMRQFEQGLLPLWSPGSYAGFPFAADTQAAVFYPLRWLPLLLSLPSGFTYQMLTLEGLAHIWLAGVFTYGLAFSQTKQRLAALVAAIAFGLGGYLTSYPLLQLAILETITWLPLVLWLLRQGVLVAERPLPWLAAAGLVLGMAALVGHPQTFLHICYLAAAYFLFLTARSRWAWRWRLGLGGGIGLIALGTALIAALPAWQYLAQTTRSDVGYEFVSQGFPLLNYLHLLLPRTLSLWTPEYVGLLPLALALLAVWARRHSAQSAEILFWGVVAAVAAWLSLGDKGILFELIYRVAPGFTLFRQQERLVGLVSLSLALLAAQGVALCWQMGVAERRPFLKKVAWLLGGGLLLGGFILAMAQPIVNEDWLLTLGRQSGLAIAALGLLWFGRGRAGWLLVVLLAVDLFIPIRTAMNLQNEPPTAFWPQTAWLDALQADEPGRIDSRLLFTANLGEIYDLEDVRGISPLKPLLVERFENLPRTLRWQLLNVTHVLAETQIEPSLTAVAPIEESIMPGEAVMATLYRFEEALPRAWMSYQPLVVVDDDAAIQAMQAPDFDPARLVVLTAPQTEIGLNSLAAPEAIPQVKISHPAANERMLMVETAVPGILVISEWAVPGWQAVIDGEAATAITANGGLLAFPLEAGMHQVELRYVPPGLVAGAVVTAVTLFLTVLVAWLWQPVIVRQTAVRRRAVPVPAFPMGWLTRLELLAWQHWRLILLGIVALGFGLRLFGLGAQELRGDEAFSYLFARMPAEEIIPALLAEGDPHSPLHYLLLHGWMRLAGDSELALRFVSLVPGVLLLPLLALLARHFGGRPFALLVTFLVAISQSLVWMSQDVRNQYTLGLLFILAATLLLLRLVNGGQSIAAREWRGEDSSPLGLRGGHSHKIKTRTSAEGHGFLAKFFGWVGYGVLCALAVYSHYFAAFALVGHGVYLLAHALSRSYFWRWVGAGLLAALLFVPWMVLVTEGLLAAGQLSDPATPELAAYLTTVGVEAVAGSAVRGGWLRWLFLGGLLLALWGVRPLWRKHPGWAGLLFTWLGLTTLLIYLIQFRRATFNPFYITIAAPAFWLLLVGGLGRLYRWRRGTAVLASFILIGVSLFSLNNYYGDPDFGRNRGYRGMAAHVAAQFQPGDLFLAHFPDPSLVYYLRDVPIDYSMQPARFKPPVAETEEELAELAESYERIWFVPAPGSAWDAENVVQNWLDINTLREQESVYDRLTLLAYRPLHAVDEVTRPLSLSLGQTIQLESFFATIDGLPVDLTQPIVAAPGSQVTISLLWQSPQPVAEHYTVFVQLLDENGVLVTQDDSVPVGGVRPTTTWQPGETIIDSHTLTLPADRTVQEGQIIVGMYQTETVERLLFADGSDAAVIATMQIER